MLKIKYSTWSISIVFSPKSIFSELNPERGQDEIPSSWTLKNRSQEKEDWTFVLQQEMIWTEWFESSPSRCQQLKIYIFQSQSNPSAKGKKRWATSSLTTLKAMRVREQKKNKINGKIEITTKTRLKNIIWVSLSSSFHTGQLKIQFF